MMSAKRILFILLAGVATLHFACNKTEDYPRKPDRLGSGRVKWAESLTPDGWTMVTNEDGATLGYSKSSGLQLIQEDRYAFKDLNRNNLLDQFEDWRVDFETRAASIVKEIPIGQFFTHLLPFVACMDLPGKTGTVSAAMTNFSVGIEKDGSPVGRERVASSYSKYKINTLLREKYGWDGYILTDFGIITGKNFGVENLTPAECMLAILEAGCDAFGGEGRSGKGDIDLAMESYKLGIKKLGEEAMNEIMRHSTERILRTHFNIGIVDNPYLSIEKAETVPNNAEHNARGYQAMLRSVVMLKNSGGIIKKASAGTGKKTVYIPRVYLAATTGRQASPASANPAFNPEAAGEYFNVVTDALAGKLSGPADEKGNPSISPKDIIRASAAEIARCDFALVRITSPQNGNPTYMGFGGVTTDGKEYTYMPISLQYRPYTANSEFVRKESIGGDMKEVTETSPDGYGDIKSLVKENRSYFGKSAIIRNESDLDLVLKIASAADKVIVALNVSSPMVFREFESEVDAILVGFGGDRSAFLPDKAFLEIIAGQVEPSGLLPLQMPANMETVEAQFEDVPRDMECHVDSDGNTYDFAFGLNWSGVIKDDRTAKYDVAPIVGGSTILETPDSIIKFSALTALVILSGCSSGVQSPQQEEKPSKSDYYVAAYIWPSCHDDSLGREKLWPEGTGEWEVIKKGNPRFDGHYQPRQPLWGYELDNDPKVVEKWIDVATDHGVNVFVYDWYWYDGVPYLESALNDGFLKAKNNEKMLFYIMWANHDVKHNYWNYHRYGDDTSILWDAKVDWENYKIIVDRVINQYFKQPNYFKINGEPLFSVFSVDKLLESFGGSVEETRKALDYFRDEVKKAGFPGLHIQWNQGGGSLMSEGAATRFNDRVKTMGFNSVAMYNMGGRVEDYIVYGTNSVRIREQMDSILDVPVFPCVSIGWDDTPRFPAKGIKDVVHYHNTPQSFAALLAKAKKYADSHPEQPRLITINAWNEWVEGSYLLPDMLNGFGYLEAVKEVIIDGKYDRY